MEKKEGEGVGEFCKTRSDFSIAHVEHFDAQLIAGSEDVT